MYDVLEYLASGMTPDEIVADFPELTVAHIQATLEWPQGLRQEVRLPDVVTFMGSQTPEQTTPPRGRRDCVVAFEVLDASDWELVGHEPRGATEHEWFRHPTSRNLYLWKPSTGRRATRREHMAEKIASEFAAKVGVPCAEVELAIRHEVVGCLSRDVQGHGHDWFSGEDLLSGIDPTFRANVRGHAAYSVANVERVLRDVAPPSGLARPRELDAFGVFAGYLAFDALILNRDRHAANWAVLRRRDGSEPDRMAPLYDNASSLALSMSHDVRQRRLASAGVTAYVMREDLARPFASHGQEPARLFSLAAEALGRCSEPVREHWLQGLSTLSDATVTDILDAIPGLSDPVRSFTVALLQCTRGRIADVCTT